MARYNTLADSLAAVAGNRSNTIAVSTAIESLVGHAVASSHVVVLVPDVSVAFSIGNIGRMVVPLVILNSNIFCVKLCKTISTYRPDFELPSSDRFEEHRLRATASLVDPLLQGAPEVSSLQVVSTSRSAHVCVHHAVALQATGASPVSGYLLIHNFKMMNNYFGK